MNQLLVELEALADRIAAVEDDKQANAVAGILYAALATYKAGRAGLLLMNTMPAMLAIGQAALRERARRD